MLIKVEVHNQKQTKQNKEKILKKVYANCEYVHQPNSANVTTGIYPGGEDEILVRKASVM